MSNFHSMSKHHKSFHCRLCPHESLYCDRHCGHHHEIPLIQNQQRIHPKKGSCRCSYPRGVVLRQRGILHRGHHVHRVRRGLHGHLRVHRGRHHDLHGHRRDRHDHRGLHRHHRDRHGHRGHGDGDVRPSSERLPS